MEELESALVEYALVTAIIVVCLVIFAYFGVKGTRTLAEYVWGNGEMGAWPIGLSLVAMNISGLTLALPNEVYQFGSTIVFECVILIPTAALMRIQATVLYKLKLMSLNDYVERRFGWTVKIFTSSATALFMIIYTTMVALSMAFFFSQILGISVINCFIIINATCYFFTALGGFRGVIWTDAFQAIMMLICMAIFLVIGCVMVGGPVAVYKANSRGDRFYVNWSLDPTERLSVWSALLGLGITWLNQLSLFGPSVYQRYAALRSEKLINKTIAIHILGIFGFKLLSYCLGYVLYAAFEGCDPVRSGRILRYDETLAYFIKALSTNYLIVRSIYIAGFTCASVSTLTALINSQSVLIYKDFIQKRFNPNSQDGRGKLIMQVIGLISVIITLPLVMFLQRAGTLIELKGLMNVPAFASFGVMVTGMFVPRVRSKCVLLGGLGGLGFMLLLGIFNRIFYSQGLIRYPLREMRVDKCSFNETSFTQQMQPTNQQDVFYLFRITSFLHTLMLVACTWGVTYLFHCIYGPEDLEKVDKDLISPLVNKFIRRRNSDTDATMIPLKKRIARGECNEKGTV